MLPRQTMRTLGDMFGLVGLVIEWDAKRNHDQMISGVGTVIILPHASNHGLTSHSSLSDDDSVAAGSATSSRCV